MNTTWYPWCRLGSHDYKEIDHQSGPGLCRVQVGDQEPCACPCHNGDDRARGWYAAHEHYDSLRSYIPGLPIFVADGALAQAMLAAPERWTWEILEDQVTLKDMLFRRFVDYPRTFLGLPHQRDLDAQAVDACEALWGLLRRVMLREEPLESLVAQWGAKRGWRLVAGLPWLSYGDTVGVKWEQRVRVRGRSGAVGREQLDLEGAGDVPTGPGVELEDEGDGHER